VCALLASPRARGLFRGAIMESGSCASQSRAAAQAASLAFAKQAGCPDAATAAACLRARPERTLLTASGQPAWPRYTSGELMSLRPGDQTRTITAATFGAEHKCAFWYAG